MVNAKICFLGGGTMAASIIERLVSDSVIASSIIVVDRNDDKLNCLAQKFQVQVTKALDDAIDNADIILLCVKPQAMQALVKSVQRLCNKAKNPLFISIAAGITIQQFEHWLGAKTAIVRAMPNLPSVIGCGATALYANHQVSSQQREMAEHILRRIGVVTWLENEKLIDTVTAVSGSGPAYFFLMMEAMIESAVTLGLTKKQATLLVTQTAFGAAKMALENTRTLGDLRENVASKGGATVAALEAFKHDDFKGIVHRAITANLKRSGELSKLFEGALTYEP